MGKYSNCGSCRYWQRGSPRTEWCDCFRVVATLSPHLLECKNDFGWDFTVPFDPHDAKNYFKFCADFRAAYKYARTQLPSGVRVQKKDGVFFFQTHADYYCSYFKETAHVSI